MNPLPKRIRKIVHPVRAAAAGLFLAVSLASAQRTPTSPEQTASSVGTAPTRAEVESSSRTRVADRTREEAAIELSPFEVNAEKDDGFTAVNAGTATKLGLDMKDLAAPYSVMTGEFIQAVGITSLQDAVMWSTNGGPVLDGQGADLFGGASTSTPSVMYNVRGQILNAGQQRNFFLTAGIGDTYNIERIDFGRGPNAVLFNVGANNVLGGGISTQGKRARLDRDQTDIGFTAGSWDYYRSTLDVNRVLSDRIAVRVNALWQKKNGWLSDEYNDRRGITLATTIKLAKRTELRVEGIYDKIERSNVPIPYFDNLSGWDGTTTFRGQISNNQQNGLAALADGSFLRRGPTSTVNANVIAYQGQPEGVWRENNNRYVYDPASGQVMNWRHTGYSRYGDETIWTPIYIDGQRWSREGNPNLLPIGNRGGTAGGQGTNVTPPNFWEGGGQPAFYDMIDLPEDRFSRQIANSNFVLPTRRFSAMPTDIPLFSEVTKDINFGLTHQFSDSLFLEVSGDFNSVTQRPVGSHLGLRIGYLDLNETLPDGSRNPNFLNAFSETDVTMNLRWHENFGLRANLAWLKDLGKWGKYTFSAVAGMQSREVRYRQESLSMALADDPRAWQAQLFRVRYYWDGSTRPFAGVAPTQLTEVVPVDGGNSGYTVSTQSIQPRWVVRNWQDRNEDIVSGIFAFAARYFDNRLIISPGVRIDNQEATFRDRPTSYGFLPNDPSWDGRTLGDAYWRPDAPADWASYRIGNRPTSGGVNGVNPANPAFANVQYRGDYNNPKHSKTSVNKTAGLTWHAFPWAALKLSYGDTYKPSDTGRYEYDGSIAKPEIGEAYEAAVDFGFFENRLTVTPRYYYNEQVRLGTPPTTTPINDLMNRRAWNDPNTTGINPFNYSPVLGGDYFYTKNTGVELEITGRLARGWRLTANFGNGQATDFDRWQQTRDYVLSRTDEYVDVLLAAGGALDTTRKPENAGRQVADAPGLAIADPAITNAMMSAAGGDPNVRTNAVNNFNSIWTQYDNIALLTDTTGFKRMTAKLFTDYEFREGRLKGLRLGLGWQYVDKDRAGFFSGDTIPNPAFDANAPVTATNRPWIDDPDLDVNQPVWVKRPSEFTGTITYSRELGGRFGRLEGKRISFHLVIRNLTNGKDVYYQDDGIALRAPDGDYTQPHRRSVPTRIASYQRPINFELTTNLRF
jgi:outer membrane receptor for ferric coprogen and ferric-rhodotorulic acid